MSPAQVHKAHGAWHLGWDRVVGGLFASISRKASCERSSQNFWTA